MFYWILNIPLNNTKLWKLVSVQNILSMMLQKAKDKEQMLYCPTPHFCKNCISFGWLEVLGDGLDCLWTLPLLTVLFCLETFLENLFLRTQFTYFLTSELVITGFKSKNIRFVCPSFWLTIWLFIRATSSQSKNTLRQNLKLLVRSWL